MRDEKERVNYDRNYRPPVKEIKYRVRPVSGPKYTHCGKKN